MIELFFAFGGEMELVVIKAKDIKFGSTSYGTKLASIDGLKLSKPGVIKEHPDLKDNENWRQEAIKRFKEHINKFNNEEEIAEYIIQELKKFGHIPKLKKKAGFRPEKIR